jgi:hypothetical protein
MGIGGTPRRRFDERGAKRPRTAFRAAFRSAFRLLAGLYLLASVTCGDAEDDGAVSGPVRVDIIAGGERLAGDFVAIVALADGEIRAADCPSGPTGGMACTKQGVRLDGVSGEIDITVKARGFHFSTRSFSLRDLSREGETRVARLSLTPLPPFEKNEHYATGLAPGDGPEAFRELATEMDTELGPARVVKFNILDIADEPRVYFQNTRLHPLHYDFIRTVLGVPMTLSEYESSTYRGEDRTAMAGTVIHYPALEAPGDTPGIDLASPVVVTFFPSDDLTPAQALFAHRLIEERAGFAGLSGGVERVVYLPAGEVQQEQAEDAADAFARQGAAWVKREELYGSTSLQILNRGTAYGTLRHVTAGQLETMVVSFTDILVLERLPNFLPVVAGTITEELQTPLAHVNVAARTRGTPNIALPGASKKPEVEPLLGELVRFEVGDGAFRLEKVGLEEAREFWEGRNPEPMVPEYDDTMQGLPSFEELSFTDAASVGAKAANLAELSRVLGEQAPRGFAVPFSHYDQFMRDNLVDESSCSGARESCVRLGRPREACDRARQLCVGAGDGETLREHVARLLKDDDFAGDTGVREAALFGVRTFIENGAVDPDFATRLGVRVSEIFGNRRVRIRSSTNAEDLPGFTGAGLYESVSAYASGSEAAPERIREVWASVWSWRAFEERAYWNMDHLAVRMGCAVNQAFGEEAANGVLVTQNIADPTVEGMYVNVQLGEVSVTNPDNGALPEVFSIIAAPDGVQVARQRFSSLSPDEPILSVAEIGTLFYAAHEVRDHFAGLYGRSPNALALDLEFKLTNPDRSLVIKQARPYAPVK